MENKKAIIEAILKDERRIALLAKASKTTPQQYKEVLKIYLDMFCEKA